LICLVNPKTSGSKVMFMSHITQYGKLPALAKYDIMKLTVIPSKHPNSFNHIMLCILYFLCFALILESCSFRINGMTYSQKCSCSNIIQGNQLWEQNDLCQLDLILFLSSLEINGFPFGGCFLHSFLVGQEGVRMWSELTKSWRWKCNPLPLVTPLFPVAQHPEGLMVWLQWTSIRLSSAVWNKWASDSQGTRHDIKLRCVETDDGWLMLRI